MERLFMKGCEAVAEAAIRAGCRFYAGYPITPQSEIPEYFAKVLPKIGGTFIQGESEIASINMVLGAARSGCRSMTSSSGPGLSLKAETLSFMAGTHVPAVILNAMRGGPAVGSIQPAQSDYFQATKAAGHGGFRMIVLAPATVQEAAELTYKAFDYAERDLNPVLVIIDGSLASIMEPVTLPEAKEPNIEKEWAIKGRSGKARRIISQGDLAATNIEKMNKEAAEMYEKWQANDVMVEEYLLDDAELVLVSYGTSSRICRGAIDELRDERYKVGMIRPITVSPFPYATFDKLDPSRVKNVLAVEMTIPAQMVFDVKVALNGRIPVSSYSRSGGVLVKNDEIKDKVKSLYVRNE